VLCFVNACETTSPPEQDPADDDDGAVLDWDRQYDIFGLARSFLESGAYLLGSRWLLPDQPAALFAKTFYTHLLELGEPIGKAITEGRRKVRKEHPDDISWASYIYYGDPRVCFKPLAAEAAAMVSEPIAEEPQAAAAVPPITGNAAAPEAAAQPTPIGLPPADTEELRKLGHEYEDIRSSMSPGPARTAKMTRIVHEVVTRASRVDASAAIGPLLAGSDGDRIVGLALLQYTPDPQHLPAVIEAIDASRSAFEQYQALSVALNMAPRLTPEQADRLRPVLRGKLGQPDFFGTDRAVLAREVLVILGDTGAPAGSSTVFGNPPPP
jgi:hypothetical protein